MRPRRKWPLALALSLSLVAANHAPAQPPTATSPGPVDGKPALVDQGKADPRLRGIFAPKGFKVQVVASEPAIVDPAAMAFDDLGHLYVAEWKPAGQQFDTWETLALPEGGTTRVRRSRKGTTDVVKRLRDADGDGVYESSEVVVEGLEMPSSVFPWKNSLYLTCVGRLERWSDDDNDGKFETRTVLADGFSAFDRHWLSGMTLGADGWLYLTAGDGDSHVVGPDDSRVELVRTGGVFRCKLDGSKIKLFAMGLRNPYRNLAFDSSFAPFLADDDEEDGSKFQGVRLIAPVEDGDYGWKLRPGAPCCQPDYDRAAADGERPGKLPGLVRTGKGTPSGLVVYQGAALPTAYRDMILHPDASRGSVRGYKVAPKGASHTLASQTTLMTSDDELFRPNQVVAGADGAIYVLDWHNRARGDGRPWGDGKQGRIYKLTWAGEGAATIATKPNNFKRITDAPNDQLMFQWLPSLDYPEADRAQRELIERAADAKAAALPFIRGTFLAYAGNPNAPIHARLLGLQGARQLWGDDVQEGMVNLLSDPTPEIRRLAAQALSWEPKAADPRVAGKLLERLDDLDGRVVREVALAIARHAEGRPRQPAAALLRWLLAHPSADVACRDGVLRALERMGEIGVEEVALAVRTRKGTEREAAVHLFCGLRTVQAAEALTSLVKIPDLTSAERLALVRQFQDIPVDVPVATAGLAEYMTKHGDVDSATKIAALDACRSLGNPATSLVMVLLDDDDESVRLAATTLAAQSRPPGAMTRLIERLRDENRSRAERLAIVKALAFAGPSAFASIDSAYLTTEDPEFRLAALRSLAEADRVKALPALESAIAAPDPKVRGEAVRILSETPQSSLVLGQALLARTLGRVELPAVLAALRKYDSAEHRNLLARVEREATSGALAIDPAEIKELAQDEGDPWAGMNVFFRAGSGRCSSCHKVAGYGHEVGPPLTGTSEALPTERLIDAILNPSREIKPGYEPVRLTLKDGRKLAGVVADEDDQSITLREAGGRETTVPVASIKETSKDHSSLMPARLALDLAPKDLADLVAFLRSEPAQKSIKQGPGRLAQALAIGPFAPGADKLRMPIDKLDPSRSYSGQDGVSVGWNEVEASGAGVVNLRGIFGAKPGRAYLAVQIKSPREQAAALRFAVEGQARFYLNGSKVAETADLPPETLTPAFARANPGDLAPLPELARLPLKAGTNLLIVAIDHPGSGDVRLALEVASPEPVEYLGNRR